jgi:putative phosphoribosyl transferase
MMYFKSRAEAGQQLATQLLEKYRYENCAVVALSDGSVQVGEQIASALHCILTMLIIESIDVPGEGIPFGAVSQSGNFTYSSGLSAGEADEYSNEFHGYLEEAKREAFGRINRLLGDGGVIDHDLLRDHTVILVADGLDSISILDVALDFLKPIRMQKLVVAAPVADVTVVDKLHMYADELHILDVKANYMGTDHYYETNDVPSHEETVAKINQIVLNWK